MWKQERQVWQVPSWRKCTQQEADLSFSTSPFATPLTTNQQHREIMTSHEETQSEKKQKKKNGKVLLHDEKHTQLFSHHDIKTVKKKSKKNQMQLQSGDIWTCDFPCSDWEFCVCIRHNSVETDHAFFSSWIFCVMMNLEHCKMG